MDYKNTMWMVRAGEGGRFFDMFKKKEIIAIGFNRINDISKVSSPEEIKEMVREKYPELKPSQHGIQAGQLIRFRIEFKKGETVITYNPVERYYLVGEIIDDYEYDDKVPEYHHIRKVKWLGKVPRDKLSTSTKNTLGAISTIFDVGERGTIEIINLLEGKKEVTEDVDIQEAELDTIKEDMKGRAFEFIKDRILSLDWEEMQELMAGILRGMGYRTIVSPRGPDRGRDIQASPDGLGLEEPRIFVEVKHWSDQVGTKEIRSFSGGLRPGSKGLYVSTGGYTKEARYEAERATIPVTLIDLDMLADLIIRYYDNFDEEAKKLIPLVKIYWPA